MTIDTDYAERFWPNRPPHILRHIEDEVVPMALDDPSPLATDAILRACAGRPWYVELSARHRKACNTVMGHYVREARGYIVARTPRGLPRRIPVGDGPHRTVTMQVPSTPGRVGLFVVVDEDILSRSEPLERSELSGETLSLGPRREAQWASSIGARHDRRLRGRVFYDVPVRRFVVACDRGLHEADFLRRIADAFGLHADTMLVVVGGTA